MVKILYVKVLGLVKYKNENSFIFLYLHEYNITSM